MRWVIVFLVFLSSPTWGDTPAYGEIQLGAGGVQHSNLDFYPVFGGVSVGAFIAEGLGIEAFYDVGLADDRDQGFDLELTEAYGLAARFQSPAKRGVQGFLVLGVVNYTIDQSSIGTASLGATDLNEDFTGTRISVGLMSQLRRYPRVKLSLEYRHYNADEPIRLDAILLGLRVSKR